MAASGNRREEPEELGEDDNAAAARESMTRRAHFVEISIQQAMRRGDFDDLPGAGKPLNVRDVHDPDWWIRRKIEREGLSGLGPPALTLRTEDAELDDRLDALASEAAVREYLDGFNRRVVEARRQLQGGPPVITPTRDIDAEVQRWAERRAARLRAAAEGRQREAAEELSARRRRRFWRRAAPPPG